MRTIRFFHTTFLLRFHLALIALIAAGCASTPDYLRTNTAVVEDYRGPEAVKQGVVFVYTAERPAQKVYLTGSFNTWRPQDKKYALKESTPGSWSLTLPLEPGLYQYKFVVDGRWLADPANTNTRPDGYGESYSIVEVR